jgi:hypothetical protein
MDSQEIKTADIMEDEEFSDEYYSEYDSHIDKSVKCKKHINNTAVCTSTSKASSGSKASGSKASGTSTSKATDAASIYKAQQLKAQANKIKREEERLALSKAKKEEPVIIVKPSKFQTREVVEDWEDLM